MVVSDPNLVLTTTNEGSCGSNNVETHDGGGWVYSIATAHSAGPGHEVYVVVYMPEYDEDMVSFSDFGRC